MSSSMVASALLMPFIILDSHAVSNWSYEWEKAEYRILYQSGQLALLSATLVRSGRPSFIPTRVVQAPNPLFWELTNMKGCGDRFLRGMKPWEATLSPFPAHEGQRLFVAFPLEALCSLLTSFPLIHKPRLICCLEAGNQLSKEQACNLSVFHSDPLNSVFAPLRAMVLWSTNERAEGKENTPQIGRLVLWDDSTSCWWILWKLLRFVTVTLHHGRLKGEVDYDLRICLQRTSQPKGELEET